MGVATKLYWVTLITTTITIIVETHLLNTQLPYSRYFIPIPTVTMMSSLSSIIWGNSSDDQATPAPPTTTVVESEDSLDEEDWVVVGRVAQFPGTLCGAFPLLVLDSNSYTTAASEVADDVIKDMTEAMEPAIVQAVQNESARMINKDDIKMLNSALIVRERYMRKTCSRKMMKRSNKTTMNGKSGRQSFNFRIAGACRNLKQC